jgi:hypothetical protein
MPPSPVFLASLRAVKFRKQPTEDHLLDPQKVDVVSIASDGTVELGLVQSHPWTGSEAQLQSFQQKVQTYVSYAVDGGMVSAYPETRGLPWRLVVHSQNGPLDPNTEHVIAVLAERLPEHGGSIAFR